MRITGVKKVILLVMLCVGGALLTGCGAKLTVYEYEQNGVAYNMYELTVDADTLASLERTATEFDGEKWTVARYFSAFFGGFGYELTDARKDADGYTARYAAPVTRDSELYRSGTAVVFDTDYTQNAFIRTYTAVAPNPFNGVRQKFDSVQPLQSGTAIERIKNGIVALDEYGQKVDVFPSLYDAFPYLKGMDPDGLLLGYVFDGTWRMEPSGKTVYSGGGSARYEFTRYFDDSETYIKFRYNRPVPYGWYIVALAAGVVALGVIAAVCAAGKKPKLLDGSAAR